MKKYFIIHKINERLDVREFSDPDAADDYVIELISSQKDKSGYTRGLMYSSRLVGIDYGSHRNFIFTFYGSEDQLEEVKGKILKGGLYIED